MVEKMITGISRNQENVAVEVDDFDLINVNLELTTNSCVQDDDLGLIYEVFEDTASSPFRDKTNLESTASTSQGLFNHPSTTPKHLQKLGQNTFIGLV